MAYLRFKDNTNKIVPRATGHRLWQGLQDPSNLSDKQLDYLATIKGVYLNRKYAPKSYLDHHAAILQVMYKGKSSDYLW